MGSGSHENGRSFKVVAMEKKVETRIMHEQRFGERERFANKPLNVVAECYSSALHEPFLLFPSRPLNVTLLESPLGRHSKNRCSNGLSEASLG